MREEELGLERLVVGSYPRRRIAKDTSAARRHVSSRAGGPSSSCQTPPMVCSFSVPPTTSPTPSFPSLPIMSNSSQNSRQMSIFSGRGGSSATGTTATEALSGTLSAFKRKILRKTAETIIDRDAGVVSDAEVGKLARKLQLSFDLSGVRVSLHYCELPRINLQYCSR